MKKKKVKRTTKKSMHHIDIVDTLNTFIFGPAAKSLGFLEEIILSVLDDALLIGETAENLITDTFPQREKNGHKETHKVEWSYINTAHQTISYYGKGKNDIAIDSHPYAPNNASSTRYQNTRTLYQAATEEQVYLPTGSVIASLESNQYTLNPDTLYIKEETEIFKDDTFHPFTKRIEDMLRWMHDVRHRYFDRRVKPYCR